LADLKEWVSSYLRNLTIKLKTAYFSSSPPYSLNLVLARIANPWGPSCLIGLTRRLTVASVYAYLGPSETLEFLWGKDLTLEHIHTIDIASSFFALAQWMRLTAKTRENANEIAGEILPPCRPAAIPKEEESLQGSEGLKFDDIEIEGLVKREDVAKAPLFNVTDGSGQTQEDIGKVIEKALGIKVDYVSLLETFESNFISCIFLVTHRLSIMCSSPRSFHHPVFRYHKRSGQGKAALGPIVV
jgi:hypothetical protein